RPNARSIIAHCDSVGAPATFVPGGAAGVTVTDAVPVVPFSEAVTVTDWLATTVPAVAVTLPVVLPAATVTDTGADDAALSEESATAEPPVGAACVNVNVQLDVPPDATEDGLDTSPDTVVGGVTVTGAVAEVPFSEAVTVAD